MIAEVPVSLDQSTAALYAAITGFILFVTFAAQTWFQEWMAQKRADRLAKKTEDSKNELAVTAKETKTDVLKSTEAIHETLNGNGILGELAKHTKWQHEHEIKDDERFMRLVHAVGLRIEDLKNQT